MRGRERGDDESETFEDILYVSSLTYQFYFVRFVPFLNKVRESVGSPYLCERIVVLREESVRRFALGHLSLSLSIYKCT